MPEITTPDPDVESDGIGLEQDENAIEIEGDLDSVEEA